MKIKVLFWVIFVCYLTNLYELLVLDVLWEFCLLICMYACCQCSVYQDTFCNLELAEFEFHFLQLKYHVSALYFVKVSPHLLNVEFPFAWTACYQRLFSCMRKMEDGKCNQLFSRVYLAASNKPYFDAGKQNSFIHWQQHRISSDVSLRLQKTWQIFTWSVVTHGSSYSCLCPS